jgi:hypothetical protein
MVGREEVASAEAAGDDEGGGVTNIELEAGVVGPVTGLGGIPGGGEVAGIAQEVPVVGPGVQEPIPPPIAPQEPILVGEPLVPEPIFVEEPIFFYEPIYYDPL